MYNLISTITDLPKLVGCKDFPTDQQGMQLIKLISDFINEQYQYSGNQVNEAFTKAVKRELFLDGRRIDPSTFGQHLSVNVVVQVLTAYKEFKRGEKARPHFLGLPEVHKKNITGIEAWELVKKWAKEEGQPTYYAPYLKAYEYLLENGLVNKVKGSGTRFNGNFNSPRRTEVERYLKKIVNV